MHSPRHAAVALLASGFVAAMPGAARALERVEVEAHGDPPAIAVESHEGGARVVIDGELFAEYLTDKGRQPVVWPILGPGGHEMTRSWPLGPRKPKEETDHPHHESLWFAHGGVNGHDFWHKPSGSGEDHPRIVHRGFASRGVSASGEAVLVTRNDWTAAGTTVLKDERRYAFGLIAPIRGVPRYVDATIRLTAADGDAVFADTKEGTFAVRVPGPMKVEAGLGGRIRNSEGESDANAWGRVADWVDYHGPLAVNEDGSPTAQGGIVIMSHPGSDRPKTRWHVRGYGLFAANPFGSKDFPGERQPEPEFRLAKEDSLTLRYRTVFYSGEVPRAGIRSWFRAFAATPH